MLILIFVILILAVIILLMIFPCLRRHTDRRLIMNGYFAHRGLFSNEKSIPENSLSAFALAAAKGYGIELDIRLTADDEVVVFHDDNLKRMCGLDKKVCQLTLQQLKEFSLLNSEEKIPTFKEVLNLIDGRVPLIIEYKTDTVNSDELCRRADKLLADYTGRYVVESFNPIVLIWFKRHKPAVMRGQLALKYKGNSFAKHFVSLFLLNFASRPDFVAFDESEKDYLPFKLQKLLGAFPVGWTIKSEERLRECKKDFKAYIFEGFEPMINNK